MQGLHLAAVVAVVPLVAAVLGGCSASCLHPLYTKDTLRFDESLIGSWENKNDEGLTTMTVTVRKADATRCAAEVVPYEHGKPGAPTTLDVHLVELGQQRFLDLSPGAPAREDLGRRLGTLAVPSHEVLELTSTPDTVSVRQIDEDWLRDALKGLRIVAEHTIVRDADGGDGHVVLTGSTDSLQTFFKDHAQTKGLFADPLVFTRVKGAEAKPAAKP